MYSDKIPNTSCSLATFRKMLQSKIGRYLSDDCVASAIARGENSDTGLLQPIMAHGFVQASYGNLRAYLNEKLEPVLTNKIQLIGDIKPRLTFKVAACIDSCWTEVFSEWGIDKSSVKPPHSPSFSRNQSRILFVNGVLLESQNKMLVKRFITSNDGTSMAINVVANLDTNKYEISVIDENNPKNECTATPSEVVERLDKTTMIYQLARTYGVDLPTGITPTQFVNTISINGMDVNEAKKSAHTIDLLYEQARNISLETATKFIVLTYDLMNKVKSYSHGSNELYVTQMSGLEEITEKLKQLNTLNLADNFNAILGSIKSFKLDTTSKNHFNKN